MSQIVSIFFLLLVICSPHAHAIGSASTSSADGVYFEETFFPVFVSKNDSDNPAGGASAKAVPTESGFGYDTRSTLGYVFSDILLGITYNNYSYVSHRNTTPSLEGLHYKDRRYGWGVTAGYFFGNIRLAYTHFIAMKRTICRKYTDVSNGSITSSEFWANTNGEGYQVSLGYDFNVGAGISISPTLIYQNIRYKTQEYRVDAGTPGTPYSQTLQTKAVDDDLKPMITMSMRF